MIMATAKSKMEGPEVVSQAEWLAARKELLGKEKEFTQLRDELSRQRRELPWERVGKEYVFNGQNGKETLADLFDGKSQLIVYHFMFGPGWEEGCPSCSLLSDQVGVVARERLQPRLSRFIHQGRPGERPDVLQLRHAAIPERGRTRHKRVLQGWGRQHLPYVFELRPRTRH